MRYQENYSLSGNAQGAVGAASPTLRRLYSGINGGTNELWWSGLGFRCLIAQTRTVSISRAVDSSASGSIAYSWFLIEDDWKATEKLDADLSAFAMSSTSLGQKHHDQNRECACSPARRWGRLNMPVQRAGRMHRRDRLCARGTSMLLPAERISRSMPRFGFAYQVMPRVSWCAAVMGRRASLKATAEQPAA